MLTILSRYLKAEKVLNQIYKFYVQNAMDQNPTNKHIITIKKSTRCGFFYSITELNLFFFEAIILRTNRNTIKPTIIASTADATLI